MKPIACFSFLVLGAAASAHGALLASYQMESPTPLNNAVTTEFYRPNFTNPNGANGPTHLPAGGVNGSGAYSFDGVDDYFGFAGPGYLFLGYAPGVTPGPSDPQNHDFTFSFWIKTTDDGVHPGTGSGGYDGTPRIPILGDTSGSVNFSLGIDGGTASFRNAAPGWQVVAGDTGVADGQGHYVTFVVHNDPTATLDIYVDGLPDVIGALIPAKTYSSPNVGRAYAAHYGEFVLDDVRLYDTALDAATIQQLFSVPEPVSGVLALAGAAGLVALRRRPQGR